MIDRERIENLRSFWPKIFCDEVTGDEIEELCRVYIAWLDAPENKVRAHGAIDSILNQLESWGKAYPTDIFREITDEDREWLHSTRPGLMDRIAAGMGRHMHKMIEKDIAALSTALRALDHDS